MILVGGIDGDDDLTKISQGNCRIYLPKRESPLFMSDQGGGRRRSVLSSISSFAEIGIGRLFCYGAVFRVDCRPTVLDLKRHASGRAKHLFRKERVKPKSNQAALSDVMELCHSHNAVPTWITTSHAGPRQILSPAALNSAPTVPLSLLCTSDPLARHHIHPTHCLDGS